MKRHVLLSPLADRDVDQIAVYVEMARRHTGTAFLHALRHAFGSLEKFPERGKRRRFRAPSLRDVRSICVPNFPNYLVFYRVEDHAVLVIRVVHGARRLTSKLLASDSGDGSA